MNARTRDELRVAIFDVLAAIAPEADPSAIAPDKPLRDQLDIDSFDFLNVILRLHEKLGLDIPEADYSKLATLAGALDYLAARLASGHIT